MLKQKLNKNLEKPEDETVEKKQKLEEGFSDNCPVRVSKYFANPSQNTSLADAMLRLQSALNDSLRPLTFKNPVQYVYNPLEYASECNELYIRKYCNTPKKLVFVGMNPGPFGMCQTGVPFGAINSVRDWLNIQAEVSRPISECPERPVLGFNCTRTEISGDRLWNLFKEVCGRPDIFFNNAFVYNYCPLAFMKSNGGNLTPSDLKNVKELEAICDESYLDILKLLQPKIVVSIGRYVEKRTKLVLKDKGLEAEVLCMTHPSPRVVNNQNWPTKAKQFLVDNDLIKYLTGEEEVTENQN